MMNITLLSGGLDSVVATAMTAKKHRIGLAITFDYGQRAVRREILTAKKVCRRFGISHGVFKLPWLEHVTKTALVDCKKKIPSVSSMDVDTRARSNAKAVWVPNRNAAFINIAASIADSSGGGTVIAGFNAEEAKSFPDNSMSFVEAINLSLKYSTRGNVRFESPTLHMKKTDIALKFVKFGFEPELMWCCYEGGKKLCGCCESCARTIRAFKRIGEWGKIKYRFVDRES